MTLRQGAQRSEAMWRKTIACRSEKLKHRMLEGHMPSIQESRRALKKATAEVKYVFGTLGFCPKTFVILVIDVGFVTVEDIMSSFIYLDEIDEHWNVPSGTGETLYKFADWYKQFEEDHQQKPLVIQTDFNEIVWHKHLIGLRNCRTQPNRSCKKPPKNSMKSVSDCQIVSYLHANAMDHFNYAVLLVIQRLKTNTLVNPNIKKARYITK